MTNSHSSNIGQSQPCSWTLSQPGQVAPLERIENIYFMLFGNTNALIRDRYLNIHIVTFAKDLNR